MQASIIMFSAALILAAMTAMDAKVGTPIYAEPWEMDKSPPTNFEWIPSPCSEETDVNHVFARPAQDDRLLSGE